MNLRRTLTAINSAERANEALSHGLRTDIGPSDVASIRIGALHLFAVDTNGAIPPPSVSGWSYADMAQHVQSMIDNGALCGKCGEILTSNKVACCRARSVVSTTKCRV